LLFVIEVVSNWGNYVLENKIAVVFVFYRGTKVLPLNCDAASEWTKPVENVKIKNYGNTKPNTPVGKSGEKQKTAQIVNIRGSRWAAGL
jgi:hypothetical protein